MSRVFCCLVILVAQRPLGDRREAPNTVCSLLESDPLTGWFFAFQEWSKNRVIDGPGPSRGRAFRSWAKRSATRREILGSTGAA